LSKATATALTSRVNPGGRAVVLSLVASPATVLLPSAKIDEIEDRRCGRGALVGDDLVAGGVEAEAVGSVTIVPAVIAPGAV
jgi:hypothetical protein